MALTCYLVLVLALPPSIHCPPHLTCMSSGTFSPAIQLLSSFSTFKNITLMQKNFLSLKGPRCKCKHFSLILAALGVVNRLWWSCPNICGLPTECACSQLQWDYRWIKAVGLSTDIDTIVENQASVPLCPIHSYLEKIVDFTAINKTFEARTSEEGGSWKKEIPRNHNNEIIDETLENKDTCDCVVGVNICSFDTCSLYR